MMLHRALWLALILTLISLAWFLFEKAWDRRLFQRESGKTCSNLSAQQARDWLQSHPDTQVLDVRSAREFTRGALPNAQNISLSDPEFDRRVAALDRQKPVLVYCAGGYRSRKAVEKLQTLNFKSIQHLNRGFLSWRE
jgi:rhodanese-related sulfurtransferase